MTGRQSGRPARSSGAARVIRSRPRMTSHDSATVVSVKIDDRPVGRLEIATDLDSLSRTELEALAERVRLNADLSRWEGEGGNPPPC